MRPRSPRPDFLTSRERHEIEASMPPANAPHDPKRCVAGIEGACEDPACVAMGPVKKGD
jgi:hypothetical protein